MKTFAPLLVAALLCVGPAGAQTPEQRAELARAESVGRDLYDHDRAAWLATDAIFEEFGGPANLEARARGWITERDGEAIVVTFIARDNDESVYRAVYRGGALQEQGFRSEPLTPLQLRLYRARQAAFQAEVGFCSAAYNSATLTRSDSDIVDVYLMPGTTDANEVIVGGYYRVAVDSNGSIVETQAFARSCLTLRRDDQNEPSTQPAALVFTHIQSPLPTETYVFISLTQNLPLFIAADTGIWAVSGARISFVQGPSR
jgi:hypothetical protein